MKKAVATIICIMLFPLTGQSQSDSNPPTENSAPTEKSAPTEIPSPAKSSRHLIVMLGTPGTPEFEAAFAAAADTWLDLAKEQQIQLTLIGAKQTNDKQTNDKQRLAQAIASIPSGQPLWIVMLGHGTFDGRKARFNLRGPDVTATEMAEWLRPLTQRVVVINCASASGPFINRLSRANQVIVTATKSGDQYNLTRFGNYIGLTVGNRAYDLDKDGQVSLLEAFVAASALTAEFYETEKRIATELALIDDNGDQLGTPADWFSGVRAIKSPAEAQSPDGLLANQVFLIPSAEEAKLGPDQRKKRDRLEGELEKLWRRRLELGEQEYLRQIEPLMIELARVYQADK